MHKQLASYLIALGLMVIAGVIVYGLVRHSEKNEPSTPRGAEVAQPGVAQVPQTALPRASIEDQELAFCKKQGFYIPQATTDFQPKVTPLSTEGDVLVDCYANNVNTSLSLYVAKVNDGLVQETWFFPTEQDASIREITAIKAQDINTDGSDEITFGTYGFGGSCSWYVSSNNVYSLKMNELFSKSVSADVDDSCTGYQKPTTEYSDNISQADSQMRKFLDSVVLDQKWQS